MSNTNDDKKFHTLHELAKILTETESIDVTLQNTMREIGDELYRIEERYHLEYESKYDELRSMAHTLNKIEDETHNCAMCKGEHAGGYSTDQYLKNICEILYSSEGYHRSVNYTQKCTK